VFDRRALRSAFVLDQDERGELDGGGGVMGAELGVGEVLLE
jgi:hypothetical protein